ncbi:protein of unknown function [Cyanobium sp. NIES-981]|nr:protein of unknown function [Cyanobium sp. NIES-981]
MLRQPCIHTGSIFHSYCSKTGFILE